MEINQIETHFTNISKSIQIIEFYTYGILISTLSYLYLFCDGVEYGFIDVNSTQQIERIEVDMDGYSKIIPIIAIVFLVLHHNLALKLNLFINECNSELINIYNGKEVPFDYRVKLNNFLLTINKFYLGTKFGPIVYLGINLMILLLSNLLNYY